MIKRAIKRQNNNALPGPALDLFRNYHNPTPAQRIYTVSEITQDVKLILENTFGNIWVEGELSGVRKIPTGTVFFNLKDDLSILRCVIFASNLQAIKFELKDGIKVICRGYVSVYEKRGDYQLYTEQIEPKGLGSLQLALEQLKQKLEKEGLFRTEHKRSLPYLPSRIGVVTSLSGAAIRDILKVLDRRFSDIQVIISPTQVQGEGAKEEIAQAIRALNRLNETLTANQKIEVMIVGRGGGSIEDLWAFNEEIVARAIYNSQIPVISAVGHERDLTIADLVADLRAATPSVAAELVAPRKEELQERVAELLQDLARSFLDIGLDFQQRVDDFAHRLGLGIQNMLRLSAGEFQTYQKKLALLNPAVLIPQHKTRIVDLARQIYVRIQHFIKLEEAGLSACVQQLGNLSPLNILGRGYSITFKLPAERIVKDAGELKVGEMLKTRLHQGEVFSQVKGVKRNGRDVNQTGGEILSKESLI